MKLKTIDTAEEFKQWVEAEDGTVLWEIRPQEPNKFEYEGKEYIVLTQYFEGRATQVYQVVRVEVTD